MKPTHPLDTLLNLAENENVDYETIQENVDYELVETNPAKPTQEVVYTKDDEDTEDDEKLKEIAEIALNTFKDQLEYQQITDPKYAANVAAVGHSYLKLAMESIATKAKIKNERKKIQVLDKSQQNQQPTVGTQNNNVILTDRNSLLEMLKNKKKGTTE